MSPRFSAAVHDRGIPPLAAALAFALALNASCKPAGSKPSGDSSAVAATAIPPVDSGPDRTSISCPLDGRAMLVSAKGIGLAQLEMPLADLGKTCTVRDSALRGDEGQPANAYVVSPGGGLASLLIFIDDATQSIRHITTTDSVFRTSGGVGVGSTMGELRRSHGPLCGGLGPAGIEVWPASLPGLVVGTTAYPPKMPGGGTGLAGGATAVPDSAHITSVSVSKPARRCTPKA